MERNISSPALSNSSGLKKASATKAATPAKVSKFADPFVKRDPFKCSKSSSFYCNASRLGPLCASEAGNHPDVFYPNKPTKPTYLPNQYNQYY
jgi:hypothetical protein